MSTAEDVVKHNAVNFFDPSQEQSKVRLAVGTYPAHIIKCEIREVDVKGKYRAKVYNYRVKVHKSVSDVNSFAIEDIDGSMKPVEGNNYVGREIRSAGIFFFLTPDIGDSFKANPGGNRGYMNAVTALGIECPEIEVEVDGDKRMVKSLPDLRESDFIGKPVLANVNMGKPWKGNDGVERQTPEVKTIDLWKDGVQVDMEVDDLPF